MRVRKEKLIRVEGAREGRCVREAKKQWKVN